MDLGEMKEMFDSFEDEYLKFNKIVDRLSHRPDLHAFLLLDKLNPNTVHIVASAAHDQIFLGVYPEELAKVATMEDIRDLVRCGVSYDENEGGLFMFA